MNDQMPLFDVLPSRAAVDAHFDAARARQHRNEGLHLVEVANKEFVERMRREAVAICMRRGEVFIDDLRRFALEQGVAPSSPNAWGAVFRGKGWRKVGYRASEFVSNRGHVSPVWSRVT